MWLQVVWSRWCQCELECSWRSGAKARDAPVIDVWLQVIDSFSDRQTPMRRPSTATVTECRRATCARTIQYRYATAAVAMAFGVTVRVTGATTGHGCVHCLHQRHCHRTMTLNASNPGGNRSRWATHRDVAGASGGARNLNLASLGRPILKNVDSCV